MTSGNNWQKSDWKALEGQWFNDKYQLIQFKGEGGFGAVFTVNEIIADSLIRDETEIVMKVIPIDADNLQQQIRELQLAVRLKHPCLINCDTVEQGNLNNRQFLGLVMELAQFSLADYVLEKPSQTLPPEEIITIIQSVATGLDYLHNQLDREQQRIVHRDLKPGNVLRVKNAWKISDFGIARLLEAGKTTVVSQVMGTPIYIPPEGYDRTVSPAWDLWSLGVMIIELFTAQYPFNATSPMQFMRKVLLEEPEIPDNIPSSLKEIVKGCLIKEYQQRWTAQQVLEALQENSRSNLPHKVVSDTVTQVNNWQKSDWKALEGQWFNDKYQLIHFKGDGGFGAVFTVNEIIADSLIRNETEIVMKVIPIDADNLQQQIRELQLAVRLKHPCLINCDTVEQGNLSNRPFLGLVMELAQFSLADYVLEKPSQTLPPEEILTIIQSVATGLDYLHNQLDREQQRIVHRDLKPGNVLRVKNAWKISDFGIARLLEAGKTTVVSQVIGTPIYIPPEGYDGTISPAWDLWSLGVMIIELFTAQYPFNATSPMQFMRKVLTEEPQIPDNIPSSLKEIVKGCLIKEYQQRWTAQQVLNELQHDNCTDLIIQKENFIDDYPTTSQKKYAGFWRQFFAFLIDSITFFLMLYFIPLALYYRDLGIVLAFTIAIIYFALMESSPLQATLGQLMCGIIVTDLQGKTISFSKGIARIVLYFLFCGIGLFRIPFTQEKQGLHDKIAGCLVLLEKPKNKSALPIQKEKNINNNSTIPQKKYAGFWRQVLAFVIDFVPFSSLAGSFVSFAFYNRVLGTVLILINIFIYSASMESSPLQATLGQLICGIVVTDRQGKRISFSKGIMRIVFCFLSFGIGFFTIPFTQQKQGLHDKIAGCLVLEKNQKMHP